MTLPARMRCGVVGAVTTILAMIGMSPAHANSYDYAVSFALTGGYSVTGSILMSCDQCLVGPSNVSYWEFNLIGPGSSTPLDTIASLSMSNNAPAILNSGQDPLYALPQGIFFDPLREHQGYVDFNEPGNPEGSLGFFVFSPNNADAAVQFLLDLFIGNGLESTYSQSISSSDFYRHGGYLIATLPDDNINKFHPIRLERREERELAATPLPAALPLFAGGLGVMGLFGWRRKRKNGVVVAA